MDVSSETDNNGGHVDPSQIARWAYLQPHPLLRDELSSRSVFAAGSHCDYFQLVTDMSTWKYFN